MESRMKRLQQYHPSFIARTLYSNSLLSSCVWYFVYFIPPTVVQRKRFDRIVHGMLWGRRPGSTEGVARVSMERLSAPKTAGGQNILQPTQQMQAIQANMVSRAMRQRGSWWCGRLELFLEMVQPHRRGYDAIYLPSTPSLLGDISLFWGVAVQSWQQFGWESSTTWHRHREAKGAFPLFGPQALGIQMPWFQPSVTFLQHQGWLYASDVWDYSVLGLPSVEQMMQQHSAALSLVDTPSPAELRGVLTHIHNTITSDAYFIVEALSRLGSRVGDGPKRWQYWGTRDGRVGGRVERVYKEPSTTFCPTCTHGQAITITLLAGVCVCGELTLGTEKERVCSCQLGKLITHDGWAYGVESQNIVDIPHLVSGTDITLYSPVKLLRTAIHRRIYPTLTPQPNSPVKWRQEWIIPLRLPWEELWPVICSAQVSGQVRSLLYFLMHRALPLLSRS